MNVILILSAAVVVMSLLSHYNLGRGRLLPTYCFSIACAVSAIVLNTLLFLQNTANEGVLLFHVMSSWQIATSAYGLYNLQKQRRGMQ